MIWQDFAGRTPGSGFQEALDGGFQSEYFILVKLGYIGLQRMNIRAVAKRARVSTATVSRTINGSDKVSPKTAARVLRAVEDLNFYPDTNARALGTGRSRLYGLIISDITN